MTSPTTLQQLEAATAAFIDQSIDAAALEEKLADLAMPVAEGTDSEARALHALLWRLLSEYDLGDLDEAALRRSLGGAASARRAG